MSISLLMILVRGRRINRPPLAGQSVSEQNGMGTSSLSDSGLADVGDGFKRLEKLSLIWCCNVTDVGLSSIVEKSKVLKSLDIQVISHKLTILPFYPLKYHYVPS
ncbi:F-box/LRR-repeat protein 4 [Abeliophyllum distichum]|uniref:F-box/LRR-repeat protein 4 n=1 Tax=Abeliophyllum distichum TaxID=126358 RepID=A0ABD1SZZ0_9LAMI